MGDCQPIVPMLRQPAPSRDVHVTLDLARNGPQAMSAIWSVTGAKRTWQGKLVSVENDPEADVTLDNPKVSRVQFRLG